MRIDRLSMVLLAFLALTLGGCAVPSGLRVVARQGESAVLTKGQPATPTPVAPGALSAARPTAAASASTAVVQATTAPGAATPGVTAAPTSAVDRVTRGTVQAIIQKANDEQQQAFARHDDSLMRDTATADYYAQLVQTNHGLVDGGVSAIKLIKLEWGPLTARGAITVEATTYETWRTTFSDGTTEEDRERNVYTLVQQGGAWKIQDDAHPDANLDQSSGNPASQSPGAPGRTPSPPSAVAPARSGQSHNWSGYAATGGTFTSVTGTWTVPRPTTDGSWASAATWVGIGGVRHRDLIQAGTEETVLGSGSVRYNAWIELLPRTARTVPLVVSPGDSVTVSITSQGSDQWLVTLKDNTTGKSYQQTEQYTSSLSSAEWVEEAPSGGGRRVLPLENFGTLQFTGGSAVMDGKTVSIAAARGRPISMIDNRGQVIAQPSTLSGDGSGFSVSFSG